MDSPRQERPTRVVLLVAGGELAAAVVNALHQAFPDLVVLEEDAEGKWAILRRRVRLLGPLPAVGQALGGVLFKLIARLSRPRLAEIHRDGRLDMRANPHAARRYVGNVNSEPCRNALVALAPQVVAVYGTRILSAATLASVKVPFINYHAGINPKYRGQQPGYWAMREGDAEHAGVTIHLVDRGVDTGDVLHQARVAFTSADNITTYQHVQMVTALPLFIRAIEEALDGRLAPRRVDLPSRQWFPPTLWSYLFGGIARGVW
ncbi:MAG: formyl transferase [Hyphomicrobiaceae bacterium]